MSDIVTTTGRRMSRALQDAIDNQPDRRVAAEVFSELAEASTTTTLRPLYAALALELRLAELREQDVLHRLAVDAAEGPDDPRHPIPPASGPAMVCDPDTGEIRRRDEEPTP